MCTVLTILIIVFVILIVLIIIILVRLSSQRGSKLLVDGRANDLLVVCYLVIIIIVCEDTSGSLHNAFMPRHIL